MINKILGKKLAMSQKFTDDGLRISFTRIQAGPCVVVDIKTADRDGYQAVVFGFDERKESKVPKPVLGELKKAGLKQRPVFLRELKADDGAKVTLKVGDIVKVDDIFKEGDLVDVAGISKGKGFAGVVKRWSFAGGPATHGQSDRPRAPGSIGPGTDPGRVFKGKKMPGRMGNDRRTIRNLEVVGIDSEKNIVQVKGGVPGGRNGLVVIRKAIEKKVKKKK